MLNISDNTFDSRLLRELETTKALMLGYLNRVELPPELRPVLIEATELYFLKKYPDYASGGLESKAGEPQIASISDNGQSVSYRSDTDKVSAKAIASGLDPILGRFWVQLNHWRLVRLAYYERKANHENP